jgi:hypothetical protein
MTMPVISSSLIPHLPSKVRAVYSSAASSCSKVSRRERTLFGGRVEAMENCSLM